MHTLLSADSHHMGPQTSLERPQRSRRFFIGNLSEEIPEHILRDFCSAWGQLKLCKVMKEDDTGRSRGFGFVEFQIDLSADKFEQAFPHVIHDRHLNVKRCGSIKQPLLKFTETKRVLVSHLTKETPTYFLKYFSKYGPITKIMDNFGKDVPLIGYTFIDFAYPQSVTNCLRENHHMLKEICMEVNIRKVFTKEQTLRIFQKEREETYRLAREQTGSHSTSIEITRQRTENLLKNKDVVIMPAVNGSNDDFDTFQKHRRLT